MAAVAAHRIVKPERVGKHRFGKTLAQTGFLVAGPTNSMSQGFQLQPTTTTEPVALASPNFSAHPDVTGGATAPDSFTRKRKASKSSSSTELRRALSTPQLRGLAMNDPTSISPTVDKRRSKLGYHRTSVACGHCRRRKIRCMPPTPEDPQGRCNNCIRLKKECNFYPVTEPNQQERGVKKNAVPGAPSASTSSSPRPSGTSNSGSIDELQSTIHFQQQPSPYQPVTQSDGYAMAQVNGVHYQQPPYGYPSFQPPDWNSGYASEHSQQGAPPQGSISPYWSSAHTPVTSSYQTSPPASVGTVAPPAFGSTNFSYQQNQHAWSQPRSLSFSHVETTPHQYHYQEAPSHHQGPTLPFPPQLPSNTHPTATSPEQHPTALPSTSQPLQSYPFQPTQHWSSYPAPQPLPSTHERPPAESYSGSQWHHEQAPASRSEEGQPSGPTYGNPTSYYPQTTFAG